jgi:hypothetical protein
MIDRLLENPGPFWHELSTIVHSQEDDGMRLLLGFEFEGDALVRDCYVAFFILPAVLAVTRAQEVLAGYMGWQFDCLVEPGELLLELWARGAGLRDDEYRATVLADE